MKLQKVYPPKPIVQIPSGCKRCHRAITTMNAYADLHGRSFKDYYCEDCRNKLEAKP